MKIGSMFNAEYETGFTIEPSHRLVEGGRVRIKIKNIMHHQRKV